MGTGEALATLRFEPTSFCSGACQISTPVVAVVGLGRRLLMERPVPGRDVDAGRTSCPCTRRRSRCCSKECRDERRKTARSEVMTWFMISTPKTQRLLPSFADTRTLRNVPEPTRNAVRIAVAVLVVLSLATEPGILSVPVCGLVDVGVRLGKGLRGHCGQRRGYGRGDGQESVSGIGHGSTVRDFRASNSTIPRSS